jgi:DNA-directed RNA polymerase specialized sigma54-like protein
MSKLNDRELADTILDALDNRGFLTNNITEAQGEAMLQEIMEILKDLR